MHLLKRLEFGSQACAFSEYLIFAASPKPPRTPVSGGVLLNQGCGAESNTGMKTFYQQGFYHG
jgi:hypothetical protein